MERLLSHATQLGLDPHRSDLEACITTLTRTMALDYGNEKTWRDVVEHLPVLNPSRVDFSGDWVRIGKTSDLSADQHQDIFRRLRALSPWRKGPFELFGIPIDTEWASNIKWNRLMNNISPLNGKRILDVGCNSGYYMFRMLAHNPEMVLGIDPLLLFYYQFKILQHYAGKNPLYFLPARLEDLPVFTGYFDTVFCMGIIYHRKSPLDTLHQMRKIMTKNGELVLETLIIDGDSPVALFPSDRYARMKNVYFIPTIPCLESWLARSRFGQIRVVDISKTTSDEQRATKWSGPVSLDDFLDPDDRTKTVEGYPAPVRAMVIAKAV